MLRGATPRAEEMAGTAGLRIVVSSDSMKNATATSQGKRRLEASEGPDGFIGRKRLPRRDRREMVTGCATCGNLPHLFNWEQMMQSFSPAVLVLGIATGLASGAWAGSDPRAELGLPADVAAAMRGTNAEHIRAHVRFLSDDLLEGRGTGARGGDIAARYIATQFALDGLKPAGDNGGYLQKVEFTGVHTLPATTVALQPQHGGGAMDLKLGEDYVTNNQTQTADVDIDAPIVLVGHGN